jgi:hypothetical protein
MFAYLLILAAVVSRVVPHTWFSFTAVGSGLLFFGARRPLSQAILPIAALAATDYYLTVFAYNYPFHVAEYLPTWIWYAAAIFLGRILLRERLSWGRGITAVLMSSTSFFLISNYAMWATTPMYPHTFSGLSACYVAGLPFYRNDLLSTAIITGLVFGLPALVRHQIRMRDNQIGAGKTAV